MTSIINNKKLVWLTKKCPVCEKEFKYLEDYEPKTCGQFECIYKAKYVLKIF